MAAFVWVTIVYVLMLYCHPAGSNNPVEIEERAVKVVPVKPTSYLTNLIRSENVRAGVPAVVGQAGFEASNFKAINLTKPPEELVWEIGDVVAPLISAALSFIPGIGPALGAGLSLIYGVLRACLTEPEESPIKTLTDQLNIQLQNIHDRIMKLDKTIREDMRKERNAQLGSILNRAFHGELIRNDYVCQKYERVSKLYAQQLRNNRTIDESLRLEIITKLQNCDNFLKDTTEAFVYPEFADVLWVPSAITTLRRITFLTEVSNYGVSLKIDEYTILQFWRELKAAIKRHLEFAVDAAEKRVITIEYKTNLTAYEYEGCKIQKQLLFFDRQIYPYGVPKQTVITTNDSEVKVADFNVTVGNDAIRHIQIFYNHVKKIRDDRSVEDVLNCILGPTMTTRMSNAEMTFRVTYVPQKSYQVRVLYFVKEAYVHYNYDLGFTKAFGRKTLIGSVSAYKDNKGRRQILRMTDTDPGKNADRFEFKTAIYRLNCVSARLEKIPPQFHEMLKIPGDLLFENQVCYVAANFHIGRFVVETVLAFNVKSDDESKATIVFEDLRKEEEMNIILFGVELIVRPLHKFLSTW